MGVVYLAHDTRLDRAVALKALPEGVVADADALARFEREAKTLASLNHRNIATIHGVEEADGVRYLALEYIEGESLAERLRRGPLPLRDLIPIAIQIATGMEVAHESGIVHRDLKPGNVMIGADDRVKILDFGLAMAPAADTRASGGLADSPTLTHSPATIPGMILGTAACLSPEQARGKPVDRRADIWAFGCILYECLTGKTPFSGETVSDLIAKILEREPNWSALPAETPPRVRALIEKCLRKDPRERLRDIGDARLELAEVLMSPGAGGEGGVFAARGFAGRPGAPALWIGAAVAAVIGTLLVIAGTRAFGPRAPEPQLRRFAISAPQLTLEMSYPARISPDGRFLLFSSGNHLTVRDLERFEPTDVAGSEGAFAYFWSHDSRRIGYFKGGKLWASDLAGVNVASLCDIPGGLEAHNGDWGPDDNIVFARYLEGLYVVAATGGEPRLLLRGDSTEVDFHHPQFLPDGRHILLVAHRKSGPNAAIVVSYPEGTRKQLGEFEQLNAARYAPSGHLCFTYEHGTQEVRVVPFSASRLEITGPPILTLAGAQYPSVSRDGTLAYHLGSSRALRELVWVDRQGRVARDGGAIVHEDSKGDQQKLYRLDRTEGGTSVLVTPNPATREVHPALSPDGRWLAYLSDEPGSFEVFLRSYPDGAQKRQVSLNGGDWPFWSADGRALHYWERGALMEATVGTGRTMVLGAIKKLFTANEVGVDLEIMARGSRPPACAPAADGRFLMVRRVAGDPTNGILLVQNWQEELKKRPAGK